jgi:hypothetical protein
MVIVWVELPNLIQVSTMAGSEPTGFGVFSLAQPRNSEVVPINTIKKK